MLLSALVGCELMNNVVISFFQATPTGTPKNVTHISVLPVGVHTFLDNINLGETLLVGRIIMYFLANMQKLTNESDVEVASSVIGS